MRRSRAMRIVVVGPLCLAACGGGIDQPTGPRVAHVALTSHSWLLEKGDTVRLQAALTDTVGATVSAAVAWSSSDPGVLTVDGTGKATGLAPGVAWVRARAGAASDSAYLKVYRVASIHVYADSLHLLTGAQMRVGAAVVTTTGDTLGVPLQFTASPAGVARVDSVANYSLTGNYGGYSNPTWYDSSARIVIGGTAGSATVTVAKGSATASFKVAVDAGVHFTEVVPTGPYAQSHCGLDADGDALCWGVNYAGTLGSKTWTVTTGGGGQYSYLASAPVPLFVTGGLRFTSIAGGTDFSCALAVGKSVYCWGADANGELGVAAAPAADCGTNHPDLTVSHCSFAPIAIQSAASFSAITAGRALACGIATDSLAYCWGKVAGPPSTSATLPAAVSTSLKFRSISAGDGHACGVTYAGDAYCWGQNAYGELGNGTSDTLGHPTPVAVSGGLSFLAVSAGSHVSCGLATDNHAYCWGTGDALGIATAPSTCAATNAPCSTVPVEVAGGLTFTALASTCALTSAGAAYCWGYSYVPPTAVSGSLTFVSISATRFSVLGGGPLADSACGISPAGAAYCWRITYPPEIVPGQL